MAGNGNHILLEEEPGWEEFKNVFITSLFDKLGVSSRAQAIVLAKEANPKTN